MCQKTSPFLLLLVISALVFLSDLDRSHEQRGGRRGFPEKLPKAGHSGRRSLRDFVPRRQEIHRKFLHRRRGVERGGRLGFGPVQRGSVVWLMGFRVWSDEILRFKLNVSEKLMLDFFLPEAEKEYEKYVNKGGSSSEKSGSPKQTTTGSIATLFSGLQPILNQEPAENINALYKFELSGWL